MGHTHSGILPRKSFTMEGGWIMKILCRDYEGLKEFREGGEGVYTRWKNIERARNALGDGDFLWTWLKSMVKPLRCLHLIKRGKC